MEFTIGSKVILKPRNQLQNPSWKNQEVGIGTITQIRHDGWCVVKWANNSFNGYRCRGPNCDLIMVMVGNWQYYNDSKSWRNGDYSLTQKFENWILQYQDVVISNFPNNLEIQELIALAEAAIMGG